MFDKKVTKGEILVMQPDLAYCVKYDLDPLEKPWIGEALEDEGEDGYFDLRYYAGSMDKPWGYGEKGRLYHHDLVVLVGVQFTKANKIKQKWKERISKTMEKYHDSFIKMKAKGVLSKPLEKSAKRRLVVQDDDQGQVKEKKKDSQSEVKKVLDSTFSSGGLKNQRIISAFMEIPGMTEQAARFACAKAFKKHEYEGKFDTLLAVLRALMIDLDYTQDELPSSSVDTAIDPREELQMTVLPSSSKAKGVLSKPLEKSAKRRLVVQDDDQGQVKEKKKDSQSEVKKLLDSTFSSGGLKNQRIISGFMEIPGMTEQAARFACAKGFKKHEYEGKIDTLLAVLRALMIDLDYTQDELPSSSVDTAIDPREELQMTVLPSSSKDEDAETPGTSAGVRHRSVYSFSEGEDHTDDEDDTDALRAVYFALSDEMKRSLTRIKLILHNP